MAHLGLAECVDNKKNFHQLISETDDGEED